MRDHYAKAIELDRKNFEFRARAGLVGVILSGAAIIGSSGLDKDDAKAAVVLGGLGVIFSTLIGSHYNNRADETLQKGYLPSAKSSIITRKQLDALTNG